MKKFHYDENAVGLNILGVYDTTIHASIPTPNLEVSDAFHQTYLANQRGWRINHAAKQVETYIDPGPTLQEIALAFAETVRLEVQRRIFSQASQNTQMNMAAQSAAGLFNAQQQLDFVSGVQWITAMRSTGTALAIAGDTDFADDNKWPDVPAEAAALAALF